MMYAAVPPQQSQQQQQVHYQERLKQQMMHPDIIQQPVYYPGLLTTALSQLHTVEPIPSGNLPPGFDSTACRSVYVGNIHNKVTENQLAEIFGSTGPLENCKLIRKEKSSYGFVDYYDHRAAAAALLTLNGKVLHGQAIKVNWAYASGQREDTTGHLNIFVGDLGPEMTDATLYRAFNVYPSCSDARVMWDQRSGRSRGFGFVSFRNQEDAEAALQQMNGKWLGSRQIRCNWATKSTTAEGSKEGEKAVSRHKLLVPGQDGERAEYRTVYVGNLAHEVTQAELHRQFHALNVGQIEDVRVQRDKGFGFVRFQSHEEAASAIQSANGRVICGKSIKCSWGSKPTPAGLSSSPLPPPPPAPPMYPGLLPLGAMNQGYTGAEYMAFPRQLSVGNGSNSSRGIIPLPQAQGMQGVPIGVAVSVPLSTLRVSGGGQPSVGVAGSGNAGFEYQMAQGAMIAGSGLAQQRMYY